MGQKVFSVNESFRELDDWIEENHCKTPLLVCGSSIKKITSICDRIDQLRVKGIRITQFSGFQPNPVYESILEGVDLFKKEKCDGIIAVGGGSAIDVAKCIILFSNMSGSGSDGSYLSQKADVKTVPFLAVPTTAGTGSEATKYAVIYYNGVKQSITNDRFVPDTVLLAPEVLKTLPLYQRKATMLDALSHAIESFWSINSTNESKLYSRTALESIFANCDDYLANTDEGNAKMLTAAHIAGKAINITQTTAGHAMCYKITSMFRIAHGHAAALCNKALFHWMIANTDRCVDPRGEKAIIQTFNDIGIAMGCSDAKGGADKLEKLIAMLGMETPSATQNQFEQLKTSVNPLRLRNNPVALDLNAIDYLYHEILEKST